MTSLTGQASPRKLLGLAVRLAGPAVIAQLVTLAISPVLTRMVEPSAFGLLGVVTAVGAISALPACLRMDLAVLTARSERGMRRALIAGTLACVSIAVVTTVSLAVGARLRIIDEEWLDHPWALGIAIVLASLQALWNAVALRQRDYKRLSRSRLAQSGAQSVSQLLLALSLGGAASLVTGYLVGLISACTALYTRTLKSAYTKPSLAIRNLRTVGSQYSQEISRATPAALLNGVGIFIPSLLVASGWGLRAAGMFALYQRLATIPLRLVGQALAQSFSGEQARELVDNAGAAARTIRRLASVLFLVSLCPTAVLLARGESLFAHTFGADWGEAGRIAAYMAPANVLQLAVSPFGNVLGLLREHGKQLAWDCFRSLLVLGSFIVPWMARLPLETALTSYSASLTVSYILMLVSILHSLGRIAKRQAGGASWTS